MEKMEMNTPGGQSLVRPDHRREWRSDNIEGTDPKKKSAWEASLEPGRRGWATLEWQQSPYAQRLSEWKRHFTELDIPFDSFREQAMVDVGCGPVGIVYFLDAKRNVGVDPLADQYEQWNGYWGKRVELVKSVGEAIPLSSSAFDAVFCINCLDHTFNPGAILREIARIVKPGGLLVLHTDLDSPLRKLHKMVRKGCAELHPQSLTYEWLTSELSRDFKILKTHRDPTVFRPTWSQMHYEAFWDGLIYRFTRSNVFINHVWLKAVRGF
jgi:SAM-dependent methyltransferase